MSPRVEKFEPALHVGDTDAGSEIPLESRAVVLDGAEQPVAFGANAHVDTPAPGSEAVRERVFDQGLQQRRGIRASRAAGSSVMLVSTWPRKRSRISSK